MSIHWGMWFVHTWSWNATIRRNYEHIPGGSVVKNLPTMQETWVDLWVRKALQLWMGN